MGSNPGLKKRQICCMPEVFDDNFSVHIVNQYLNGGERNKLAPNILHYKKPKIYNPKESKML